MEGSKAPVSGGSGVRDERYDEYLLWIGNRTAEDFVGYVKNVRGAIKLSHSGILKDAGIAGSLARSNPYIKEHLEGMEDDLIRRGHIPAPAKQNTSDEQDSPYTIEKDNKPTRPSRSARDKRRIEELEQENAQLKLERNDAREALDRYGMLEQYMSETMRLPR